MLQSLSENIRRCYRKAEDCARIAEGAQSETLRADYLRSEQRWVNLARSYELQQRLTLFINENRRKRRGNGEQVVDHVDADGLATPTVAWVKPPPEPAKAERLENKLIAIVDDDECARSGLSVLIESLGYRPAAFASAGEYLASDMRENTACLIVDVHMPGMSGPDLQAHLIAEGCCPPTVFITGQFDEHVRERVIKAGAASYLTKLGGAEAIVDSIEKVLRTTA
jgi:CheY-like chemotaxis protein